MRSDVRWVSRMKASDIPLLNHPLSSRPVFTAEALVEAVRAERSLPDLPAPRICVLDFDGDLSDWLVAKGTARLFDAWPCFHTRMFAFDVDGEGCGIIPRTIGGPYAVLVAEQLAVSGARLVLGLTSAGRVSPNLPVPSVVIATEAIRDEGTSYHYLPPEHRARDTVGVSDALARELRSLELPVTCGLVWTTDAPYRETAEQLAGHAQEGALAVEMQAASLFAFSAARKLPVGVVAHVTNAVDHDGTPFDKGSADFGFRLLQAMCRAGRVFLGA